MSLNNVSSLNNMKMKDSLFLDLKICYILLMMIQILVVDIFLRNICMNINGYWDILKCYGIDIISKWFNSMIIY